MLGFFTDAVGLLRKSFVKDHLGAIALLHPVFGILGLLLSIFFLIPRDLNPILKWLSGPCVEIYEGDESFRSFMNLMRSLIGDRWGTNQIATTYTRSTENSQMLADFDVDSSLWRFDRGRSGKHVRFDPGHGVHVFQHRGQVYIVTRDKVSKFSQGREIGTDVFYIRRPCTYSPLPVQQLINEADRQFHAQQQSSTRVWCAATKISRQKGHSHWVLLHSKPSRHISTVNISEAKKQVVLDSINTFISPGRDKQYAQSGIPYRLGFLFHGRPGTGKSSLAFSAAGTFGLDVYIMSLSETEEDLVRLFAALPTRCLILLEDIDAAGIDRTMETPNGLVTPAVSMSSFLNILDGVAAPEGQVIIGSTNHLDKVDEAVKRPGRLGKLVEFPYASREDMKKIFIRIFTTVGAADRDMEKAVAPDEIVGMAEGFAAAHLEQEFSAAHIQNFLLEGGWGPGEAVAEAVRRNTERSTEQTERTDPVLRSVRGLARKVVSGAFSKIATNIGHRFYCRPSVTTKTKYASRST